MEKEQKTCIKKISSLLAENKLREAFNLLDEYLSAIGVSTDLTPYFISASSQFHRTEKEYRLGTISWEQYNISNSQIVVKTLDLTTNVCCYICEAKTVYKSSKGKELMKATDTSMGGVTGGLFGFLVGVVGTENFNKIFGNNKDLKTSKGTIEKSFKNLVQEITKLERKAS